MFEHGYGIHWEDLDSDPDDSISTCFDAVSFSYEGPPYQNKIEWARIAHGKVMRALRFHWPNEFDKSSQLALCDTKKRLHCLVCFNKNKTNQVVPFSG